MGSFLHLLEMKDKCTKKTKTLRKGGLRGLILGNPILPPVPEFHFESQGIKMSLKGYAYESVERFALTMTQRTEKVNARRNSVLRRNSGAIRERRRNSRRELVHDRPNSSRAYRQRLTSSQNIFERKELICIQNSLSK